MTEIKDYTIKIPGIRVFYAVTILLICYTVVPLALYFYFNPSLFPYNYYKYSSDFIFETVASVLLIVVPFFLTLRKYDVKIKLDRGFALWIFWASLVVSIGCDVPLLIEFFRNGIPDSRNVAFVLFESYRGNVFAMASNNLFMCVSIVLLVGFGERKYLYYYLAFCIIPELLLGSRINLIRLLIISVIFLGVNKKLILISIISILAGYSIRFVIQGYELSDDKNGAIMALGEITNTHLGSNLVFQDSENIDVSPIPGYIRSLVPPPLRRVDPTIYDFTTEINVVYFSKFGLYGLAGSPVTDYIMAPIYYAISIAGCCLFLIFLRGIKDSSPLYQLASISTVFCISSIVYLPRWGLFSSISFIASFIIWYISPLTVVYFTRSGFLINRSKSAKIAKEIRLG